MQTIAEHPDRTLLLIRLELPAEHAEANQLHPSRHSSKNPLHSSVIELKTAEAPSPQNHSPPSIADLGVKYRA